MLRAFSQQLRPFLAFIYEGAIVNAKKNGRESIVFLRTFVTFVAKLQIEER